MYRNILFMALLAAISLQVVAEPQKFTSGPQRVGTIELYTSQGCSSCPPAEAYLNSLRQSPGLWKEFIPMAFHVNYWDYLGWRDRFSSAAHSQRQRQYARTRRMNTVYTPGFFVNGQEWRRGFTNGLPRFKKVNVGILRFDVNGRQVSGEYPHAEGLHVNVALLGMGLVSDIKSGEREGSHTEHEFVVLAMARQAMQGSHFNLPLPKSIVVAPQYAVVVWVSHNNDPTPVQIAGGILE